ncbi:hypothetical protein [Actinophytocola oryzae]|uniref:Uncharacterized protein n=1 Tax=Actinophytocola oryzae TaxID=502181 RepID=A0A4R7UPJ3_9PSEU|nr:hypothetical protein [Actinophytocola oryzae]TDV35314.1 hypothetical protein CLV71_13629 [Actinophytocola oryzae]
MAGARHDEDISTRIAALGSLYQAERSENLTLLNINMAFLGAVLAYVAASVAFLDKMESLPRLCCSRTSCSRTPVCAGTPGAASVRGRANTL